MNKKRVVYLFIIILCIELFFVFYIWNITCFKNPFIVVNVDNLFSADVARNIIENKGYRTNALSLYEVNLYNRKGWLSEGPSWFNTYRFPLPILTMACLFKIFGNTHFIANFFYPTLFHFLSVIAIYTLVLLIFKNDICAYLGSLIFITNNGLLYTMVNKNESSDIFFFTLSLILFYSFYKNCRLNLLLLLGIVLGLSFLNRFNQGAILFAFFSVFLIIKKRLDKKRFILFLLTFLIVIIPFLLYNYINIGIFFISSNSYFQILENSIISKYMNPWWKLNYSIDIEKPITYISKNTSDFLHRTYYYLKNYTVLPFFEFRGSFWWWFPIIFVLIRRLVDEKIKLLFSILLFLFIINIILLSPFCINIRYLQYLFILIIGIVSYGVYELSKYSYEHKRNHKKLFLLLTFISITISAYGNINIIYIILLIFVFFSLTLFSSYINRKIILLIFSIMLIYQSIKWIEHRIEMFDIYGYTDRSPSALIKIKDYLSPNEIVVTTHPWNTVWFSKRPSIPIPEYPDEIYILIKKYKLNIKAIYLSNIDIFLRHANHGTPISMYSYMSLVKQTQPIKGFNNISKLSDDSMILFRDNTNILDILDTRIIDFGKMDANSHIIYGFSEPIEFNNKKVRFLIKSPDFDIFDKQPFIFLKGDKVIKEVNPDAEITFLHFNENNIDKKRYIRLFIFNGGEITKMRVVLNVNLFSYSDIGELLASRDIENGWNLLEIQLSEKLLKDGLNKLTFWFDKKENAINNNRLLESKLKFLEIYKNTYYSIAFEKIEFYNKNM